MGKIKFNPDNIIQNATIIYTDDIEESFEALRINDNGVIIGRILKSKFVDCGFISKRNIKQIKKEGKKNKQGLD